MLFRHTILYLPAQLLPALAQFLQLIFWSHFASAEVIGTVTLYISIQEFLVLGFMGFWTSYTVRHASAPMDGEEHRRFQQTSTAVVLGSSIGQALVAVGLYVALIDPHPRLYLLPILLLVVWGRAFNSFQGERGRGRGDILLYSVETITGPLAGMIVGIALLAAFGGDELWIFAGIAVAQVAAALFGLVRDYSWVRFGPPELAVFRRALSYGAPLIFSSAFAWLTQNAPRWFTSGYLGLAAAGVYSLGFGLGFRVSVVAAMSVTAAAFPLAVRYANAGDQVGAMRQLSRNAVLLLGVLASSMTGLALVSRDLVDLVIAAPMRAQVVPVMLWSLLAGSLICVRQHFLNQVFLLRSETRAIGIVAGLEVIPAILASWILVPRLGPLGGILSLTATSALSAATMFVLALRKGLRVPWADFLRIALSTAAMALAVSLTPAAHTPAMLAARIAAGGAAYASAILLLYRRPLLDTLAARRQRKRAAAA